MRQYSKISPNFWTGKTGKEIRKLGPEVQVIALYLLTCPNSNMLGYYYLPLPVLCHETGSPFEGASKGLRSLEKIGFAYYDPESEHVWVKKMALHQIGPDLQPSDNRIKGLEKEIRSLRKGAYFNDFLAFYKDRFHLKNIEPLESPSEAPSEPLPSPSGAPPKHRDRDRDLKNKKHSTFAPSAFENNQNRSEPPVHIFDILSDPNLQHQENLQGEDEASDPTLFLPEKAEEKKIPPTRRKRTTTTTSTTAAATANDSQIDAPPPVVLIPLTDKSEFAVSQAMVSEWSEAFPAVNIILELRKMRQWCLAHPQRRKTKRGVKAFIVSWLSRTQDKGGSLNGNGGSLEDPWSAWKEKLQLQQQQQQRLQQQIEEQEEEVPL